MPVLKKNNKKHKTKTVAEKWCPEKEGTWMNCCTGWGKVMLIGEETRRQASERQCASGFSRCPEPTHFQGHCEVGCDLVLLHRERKISLGESHWGTRSEREMKDTTYSPVISRRIATEPPLSWLMGSRSASRVSLGVSFPLPPSVPLSHPMGQHLLCAGDCPKVLGTQNKTNDIISFEIRGRKFFH